MHYYTLDSKTMDSDFLARKPVRCNAVVPVSMISSLHYGNPIVVQLTDRSKYKGIIRKFEYQIKNDIAEGFLEIVRA